MAEAVLRNGGRPDHVEITVDAATGKIHAPDGPGWDRALMAMRAVIAEDEDGWTKSCLQQLEASAAPAKAP